ncbi:MAG: bifunctional pyr operon transcriptional regulator/uracil phosphoribosyltransferase PyrR [Nitrolancea sp.]
MTEPDAQAGGSQHLLDNTGIHAALDRLAEQIAKRFGEADDLCLIGVRRRGDVLAGRLRDRLQILLSADIPTGSLDITLYRDDFDSMSRDPIISESDIPFQLDGRTVILVDDVIFTGRTVRAALDEILDLGRPDRVALAVLIDRGGRELPIAADLIGQHVETADGDEVLVLLNDTDGSDAVILRRAGD